MITVDPIGKNQSETYHHPATSSGLGGGCSGSTHNHRLQRTSIDGNQLPASALERDMEAARDKIVTEYQAEHRAKTRAAAKKAERANQKEHLITAGLGGNLLARGPPP
jgi:hypothetical protein